MGALASDNQDAHVLLNAVAVDFFMAASNIDYLQRLEVASTVDALTGVMNRTSYHLRLDQLSKRPPESFACVYIDVNDLHAINNRFGQSKPPAKPVVLIYSVLFSTRSIMNRGRRFVSL